MILVAPALLITLLSVWAAPFPRHGEVRVPEPAMSQAAPTPEGVIDGIEFSGLRRISPEALRTHITSRVGEPLDRDTIEGDVRALDRLGWFDSVTAEVYPMTRVADGVEGSGLRLVFVLQERPFLTQVEFHGSHLLSRERRRAILAEKQIPLKMAAPVNRFELWRATRAIEEALADLGHPRAQVRVHLEEVATAAVRASFDIQDGPYIPVGRVTFVGNRAFPADKLRHQMKRVAPNAHFATLRAKNIYTPKRLDEDLERLADYYRNHGYPEARLGFSKAEVHQDRLRHWFPFTVNSWPHRRIASRFHISIPVEEGKFYRLEAVEVQTELAAQRPGERLDALPAIRRLKPGEPYSQQKLERAREALARLHPPNPSGGQSLPPEVELMPQFDRNLGTARITFRVREAHPYIVRRLEFVGQRRFSDRFYRRHVLLKEGEPFDPSKLELGLTQLARTGFIRPVKRQDIRLRFDEVHHTTDVAIRVEEIGRQKVSLTGGRSDLGSSLGIVYNVFDLFGGEELITAHFEEGPASLHLLLGLAKEGLFGTRASFGLSLFRDVVRPNLPSASGRHRLFTSRNSGLGLSWTYPVAPADTLAVNYGVSHTSTQYDLVLPPGISGLVGNQLRSGTSSRSVGLNWSHEAERERWNTGASVSGGWLGGRENLARSSVEYVRLQPDPLTDGRDTWAFRGYAAGVSSLRGDLPLHERYFPGEQLVRGFRTGELAPYALVNSINANGADTFRVLSPGADLIGAVNAEYRVPVASRTEAAGFFDAGCGWLLPNWVGPDRPSLASGTNGAPRASTGVEMRWVVPVLNQPLGLHFAVNPLRLRRSFLLPDGSRFRPPDRRTAWGWTFGSFF